MTTYPAPEAPICRPAMAASNLCGELIPPLTEVAVPTTQPVAHGSALPVTGADLGLLGIWGAVAFVLGALLTKRRRRG